MQCAALHPKLAKTPLSSHICRYTSCRENTFKLILFGMKRLLSQAQLVSQTGHCHLCICLPLLLSALKPSHSSALPTNLFLLRFSENFISVF